MNRRQWLVTVAASLLTGGTVAGAGERPSNPAAVAALRREWRVLLAAGTPLVEARPAIAAGTRDWRTELPAEAYRVLFEEDTEAPGSSPLNDEKRAGVFLCRACDLPLFSSAMKYDSGTGWPSFFTAIPGHLATKTDFKLIWPRTEYHCVKCGGHQGHVFDDGPAPTGERWCNNGVALSFVARDG